MQTENTQTSLTKKYKAESYIDADGKTRSLKDNCRRSCGAISEKKVISMLQDLIDGIPLKQAAEKVDLVYSSSKNLLRAFYVKYKLTGSYHAIGFAVRNGWIK